MFFLPFYLLKKFSEFCLDALELMDLDFKMSFDYKYFDTLEQTNLGYSNHFAIFLAESTL